MANGTPLSIPDFALKIKTKYPEYKDVDDTLLVNKIVEKYPEYKEQVDFGNPVKKKEPTIPSSQVLSENASHTISSSGTKLETEEKPIQNNPYSAGVPPDDDLIGQLMYSNKLKGIKSTSSAMSEIGGDADAYDPAAQDAAKKIDEGLSIRVDNPAKLFEQVKDVPERLFMQPGFTKAELMQDRKDNPQLFERKLATGKWQIGISDSINKQFKEGNLSQEDRDNALATIKQNLDNINVGDYRYRRETSKRLFNTIEQYGGEDKGRLKKNLAIDLAKIYGGSFQNKFAETAKEDPNSKFLDETQLLAYQFLQDTDPEKAKGYGSALIDENKLGNNLYAQHGLQEKKARLTEIGVGLQQSYIQEQLNDLAKIQSVNGQLSPNQEKKAAELTLRQEELNDVLAEKSVKYGIVDVYNRGEAVQEILGQENAGAGYLFNKVGTSTANTVEGVVDLVSEPFRSDEGSKIHQLEAAGENMASNSLNYVTSKNSALKNFELRIQPELQKQIDAVKNDGSLSRQQKEDKVNTLLRDNSTEWGRVPIQGGKVNINPSSLFYSIGGLAADLVPFMALETVTGGGATAGAGRKLLTTFTSAAATGFHDAYATAVRDGEANPFSHALRVTAINSAALAGAGTPQAIRTMLGTKTAVGELVSKMSDDAINAALKQSPSALKNFGKSVLGSLKTSTKEGAKISAFTTGGEVANMALDGKNIDPETLAKQALVSTLTFSLGGGLAGIKGRYDKVSDLQSDALIKASQQPELFIEAANKQYKEGGLTAEQLSEIKQNVEKAAEVSKKLPFVGNDGKPLSSENAAKLLMLKMREAEIKESIVGDAPPALKEKNAKILEDLNAEIEEVYKNKDGIKTGINRPQDLRSELNNMGASEKMIEAIPEGTTLSLKQAVKITGGLKDLLFAGVYNRESNNVQVSKIISSLVEGGADKVTLHEATHAATINTLLDIYKNPKNYTAEQIDAAKFLHRIGLKYEFNTSKEAKRVSSLGRNRLYGTSHPFEFIAEFISNPKFRDYVSKTNPENKITARKLIWDKILSAFGASKKEIDQVRVADIERSIDTIFEAGRGRLEKEKGIETSTNSEAMPIKDTGKLNKYDKVEDITRAKELVNFDEAGGVYSDGLKESIAKGDDAFLKDLKEIAEQASNPASRPNTINIFGKDLVDIAERLGNENKSAIDSKASQSIADAEPAKVVNTGELNNKSDAVEGLFDGKKTTEEIVSGIGKVVNDKYVTESIKGLLPYLKNNPEIKFSKMFSVGSGEAHYTGDWTVLLSNIKDNNQLAKTVLHELYHSISINELKNNQEFSDKVDGIVNEARRQLKLDKYFDGAKNTDFGVTKDIKYYGLLNSREFIAELFSNKEFSDLLDKTKIGGKSLLDKFIDLIKKVVGIPEKTTSAKIKEDILKGIDTKISFSKDKTSIEVANNFKNAARESDYQYEPVETVAEESSKEPTVKSDVQHAEYIKSKFAEEFVKKGVPKEQIDAAVALMEARAKASGKGDSWYRQIEDIGDGEFSGDSILYQFFPKSVRKLAAITSLASVLNYAPYISNRVVNHKADVKTAEVLRSMASGDTYIFVDKKGDIKRFNDKEVYDAEEMKDIDKEQIQKDSVSKIAQSYLDSIWSKAGNPKIEFKEGSGRSHYRPLTNTIIISIADKPSGSVFEYVNDGVKYYAVQPDVILAEMAHALQSSNGEIRISRAVIDFIKSGLSYEKSYDTKGTIEYDAHKVIEKQLVEGFEKTLKFQEENGERKGAVETLANGKKIIHALDRPDFSTAVHELAHIFEDEIPSTDRKIIQDWAGTKEWNTKTSETFARGFERYLMDGEAPTTELKTIFQKAKEWLTSIYENLKTSLISKNISPEVKSVFDNLFKENKKSESVPPKGKEPVDNGIFVEDKRTILSHKGLQEVATEFGLDDVSARDRISDLREFKDAEETIDKWAKGGMYKDNIEKLISDAEGGEALNFQQRVIMQQHLANVRGKVSEIRKEKGIDSPEYNKALLELSRIKEAGQRARSTAGAALRVGEISSNAKPTMEDWMSERMESLAVEELTPEQKKATEQQFNDYEAKLKIAEEKTAQFEEEISRLKAEVEVAKNKKSIVRKKNREYLAKERTDIVDSIREKLKKSRGETSAVAVPYAKELIAIAPDVAKLVRNLVETGTSKLEDIVDNIHEAFKNDIPWTKKDTRDVIAGVYNEPKPMKSALELQLKDLKDEAKLLKKLEDLQAGVSFNPKVQAERNRQITELKSKIKDFKKNNPDAEAQLRTIKSRNETAAKKIQERIDAGDFETKKQIPFDENAALKKANPKLWRETMDAIVSKNEARDKFDLTKRQDELNKTSWSAIAGNFKNKEYIKGAQGAGLKLLKYGANIIHTARAIKAGIDNSITFVQLGMAIMANPKSGAKAKFEAFKDINDKRFKRELAALHQSPIWPVIEKSGLEISEPKSLSKEKSEEIFENNLFNRDFKIGDKKVVNPWTYTGGIFERLFTSMGNNMRVNLFIKRMDQLKNDKKTFESHPQEYKDAARVINEMTGRGKMNKHLEKASPVLTPIIWAPRMLSSSLNVLGIGDLANGVVGNKGFYSSLTPSQRKYALGQMTKGIGMGVAVMTALALNGWRADYDPESVGFGTVSKGTKRYNVFGRYASTVRFIVQLATGRKYINNQKIDLDDRGRIGSVQKFVRGKMTPAAGLAYDYILNSKKNSFTKEPITLNSLPNDMLTPISVGNIKKGLDQDGTISLLTRFLPEFEGIQVSDERDFPSKDLTINDKSKELLTTKGIKIPRQTMPKTFNIYNPVDETKRISTPKEVEKYVELRDKKVKEKIENILGEEIAINQYGEATIDPKAQVKEYKAGKDLTTEQLKKLIKAYSAQAGREAKQELFGEGQEEPIEDEEDEDEKK